MIRFAIISCILVSSGFFMFLKAQEGESEIDRNLRMADIQINLGDNSRALLLLEDVLVMQPNNIEAQEKKINILIQQGRIRTAFTDIEEYISMYPSHPEYYYLRALLHLHRQKNFRAIDDFNRAIQNDMPANSVFKVYLNRGLAYFNIQDYDLAVADFDEALALNSKSAAAYHGKGMALYGMNLYEDAVVEFQRSIKLEDSNPIAHYNLAMTYFRLDELDNACFHFNKSCAMGHRNACRLMMMECNVNIPKK